MNKRLKKKHKSLVEYRSRFDDIHTKEYNRACLGIIKNLFENDIDGSDGYIIVHASEKGREPHFHVDSKHAILHTSFLFKEAAYYMDSTNQTILNSMELNRLYEGLKTPSKIPEENIWERSLSRWNFDVFNKFTRVFVMPDYRRIEKIYLAKR